jgi:O-antigen ligase
MGISQQSIRERFNLARPNEATGAFFWLSVFFLVYSTRPEDWIPGLSYIPLAKISVVFAVVALFLAMGRTRRKLKDLPRESKYLLALILLMLLFAPLSPVWKGGALLRALDFAKVYIGWVLTYLLVTSLERLRRLILIQSVSVALVALISIFNGSSQLRLHGVLNGIYGNPNDLAFAIVLTIPLILLLLLTSGNVIQKMLWAAAIVVMLYTLFLTASRAGFVDLVISSSVALWFFGVKGKRPALIFTSALVGVLLLVMAGRHLGERWIAITGTDIDSSDKMTAYFTYQERKFLMVKAVDGILHYPLTGVGTGVFPAYSGHWKTVHMTYLQIAVEAGLPALVLYLLFFGAGFRKLRELLRKPDPKSEITMFAWALYCSLLGFAVGACFAPEAYQFFPYFTVAYISALAATAREQQTDAEGVASVPAPSGLKFAQKYGKYGQTRPVHLVR